MANLNIKLEKSHQVCLAKNIINSKEKPVMLPILFLVEILKSNALTECYTKTDEALLNKLRANAANAKPHVE